MWQTPVLFICPVTRPHLPNTAQIPLENRPLPPLTPRGLSETHTLAQLHGVAQAQGGGWLMDGNSGLLNEDGPQHFCCNN